jgi:hypothetical protein
MSESTCHPTGTCDHGTCCSWHCEDCQSRPDRPEANWFYAKDSGRDLSRAAV